MHKNCREGPFCAMPWWHVFVTYRFSRFSILAVRTTHTLLKKNSQQGTHTNRFHHFYCKQALFSTMDTIRSRGLYEVSELASIKNTIILFVFPSRILHKHCFQSIMVFLILANSIVYCWNVSPKQLKLSTYPSSCPTGIPWGALRSWRSLTQK